MHGFAGPAEKGGDRREWFLADLVLTDNETIDTQCQWVIDEKTNLVTV